MAKNSQNINIKFLSLSIKIMILNQYCAKIINYYKFNRRIKFEIKEKYNKNLYFNSVYFPNKSCVKDLYDLISRIKDKTNDGNKKKDINEDLKRLNKIKEQNLESKVDSLIYVKEFKIKKMQQFLNF